MIGVAPTPILPLSNFDLLLAALFVVAAGVTSLSLGLRLERRLAWASVRTVVQLLLVGYVLRWVFDVRSVWLVLAMAAVMLLVAAQSAVARTQTRFAGLWLRALVTLTATGLLTTTVVTGVIVGAKPWYQPQYFIPLLGMVLGNGLNGVSLCLDALLDALRRQRDEIEMELALGATRWEAARDKIADAVRRGMIPIINSMMVVGVVSLPGMMTGQILAGADPLVAVRYQIVVMFMVAGATALGCVGAALLAYRRLFTSEHRLDVDALRPAE